MIINSEEARAWLRLLLTPGVGPVSVRRLLAALGSPQAVCAASAATLGQLVPAREAQALAAPSDEATALFEDQWARTAAWLADRPHRHLVSLGDARYPVRWLDLADPPVDWRGSDTYIQRDGINQDFGVFDDPDAFYARHGAKGLRTTRLQQYRR